MIIQTLKYVQVFTLFFQVCKGYLFFFNLCWFLANRVHSNSLKIIGSKILTDNWKMGRNTSIVFSDGPDMPHYNKFSSIMFGRYYISYN